MPKALLKPSNLYQYQRVACLHQLYQPHSMLWLGMGLGKTPITLTTINHRIQCHEIKKTLIFAPLRVVYGVWEREALKWQHTRHLRFAIIHGTEQERIRAIHSDADIYLTNYESMNWLTAYLLDQYIQRDLSCPFQMVVFDEITKVANAQSLRMKGGTRERKAANDRYYTIIFQGWRKMIPHIHYTTGLTGTPSSQGYIDLFGQYLALDGGQRLGQYITHYRNNYFQSDYMGWTYSVTDLGKQAIQHQIADITVNMESKDYLDMPAVTETDLMVDLPTGIKKHYKEIEKELFTRLDNGTEIELFTQSSVSNKLLQICNGSAFTDLDGHWEALHARKLDALAEIIEAANGRPVLCAYRFKFDAIRIMQHFKKLKPVNLSDEKAHKTLSIVNRWNTGKIRLLIGHPASVGHGLDGLQESGSTVAWFGINWSLQLYNQLNGRIDRHGQQHPVSIIRIQCRHTLDEAVAQAIRDKDDTQQGLRNAMNQYRKRNPQGAA